MQSKSSPSNGQQPDSRPLVFVVDDEPMLLELASMILEPLGCRVKTFRDPKTAVREFSLANPLPALVITDFAMHQMNGLDLIRDCRLVNPHQRILLVSGTVDARIYQDSLQQPDAFLAKPYLATELAGMVKALLAE
jgi:CheY-like chemotaxis protein